MKNLYYKNLTCISLENKVLTLIITKSVGPRILSLQFQGGENLFAEAPNFKIKRPDGQLYHFYGGHRLWHAPEHLQRSYVPDDAPVDVRPKGDGVLVTQPVEAETGLEKSLHVTLSGDKAQVQIEHRIKNRGLEAATFAPWTITQFKTGGVAILPQRVDDTGVLPNRSLTLWQYTDIAAPQVTWGNRYLLVHAVMRKPFKIGFPNYRGWLAYWFNGTLFVKRAGFNPQKEYYDANSSSECYCNDKVLELETLAPITCVVPGQSATHLERWEVYGKVERPNNEATAQKIVERLGLDSTRR